MKFLFGQCAEANVDQIETRIVILYRNEQVDIPLIVRIIQDNISPDCE
jgi:hypothetical protein